MRLLARVQVKRNIGRRLLQLTSCWLFIAAVLSAQDCESGHKKVLILFSQRSDFGFSSDAADRFVQSLSDGVRGCLDDYREYLDAARFGDSKFLPIFRDFLARKYAGVRFDMIVTMQRPALSLIELYGPTLFPETPIFFIAGKGLDIENERPGPNFAGVLYKVDLRRTLTVAMKIHPSLKRIYVLSGASQFDKNYEQGARDQFHEFEDRLQFTYLSGLPMDELDHQIRRLPADSAVYLMSVSSDRNGIRFLRNDITARVAAASNVPVYSVYAIFMGHGIVGGSLVSLDRVLLDAAPGAVRVLRSEPLGSVGVSEVDPNVLEFDSRQLKHWGIPEVSLPPGSAVLYREPGIWEQQREAIIAVSLVITIQAGLILLLLLQRRRRQIAETTVRNLAGKLLTAEEAERKRIARDLHDGVCQEMAYLAFQLGGLLEKTDVGVRQSLTSIQELADGIADSLRLLSHELHPATLLYVGLQAALQTHCTEVELQQQISVTFTVTGQIDPLDPNLALGLFRIVQEALRNTAKHANARHATVSIVRRVTELELLVSDNGNGFDVAAIFHAHGLGLVSMRERVRLAHGRIAVESKLGCGTTIKVSVPIRAVRLSS